MKTVDNFKTLIIVFVLVALLYLFVFTKNQESFKSEPASFAPASVIKTETPNLAPRTVAPSGPNPPNAKLPNEPCSLDNTITYNVAPNDAYDELYGSQNIQDNLRYPERSFSPGIINGGSKLLVNSGVASTKMLNTPQPIQPFANELIQNGGLFGKVGADDTHINPNYASF